MTGAEVRALKDEEIEIELGRLREKLFTMRVQTVTEKVEDNSQFKKARRDVARLLGERRSRMGEAVASKRVKRKLAAKARKQNQMQNQMQNQAQATGDADA